MNKKTKTIILIIIFVLFITFVYLLYEVLNDKISPQNQIGLPSDKTSGNSTLSSETPGSTPDDLYPAPHFKVFNKEGDEVNFSDYIGKPIVINFWASWCPPCKKEMPDFNKAYNEYKDEVVFMMINAVDNVRETQETGQKYIYDNGYTFPVYFDNEYDAQSKYGIMSLPTTIFINTEGNILFGYRGAIDYDTLVSGIEIILE